MRNENEKINAGENDAPEDADEIIDSSWYIRPENIKLRTSAGGVVLRRDGERVLVALTRESGMTRYLLPKGGVEKGETLLEAARREIEEEAGISQLTPLSFLAERQRLDALKRKWITTHYFLFLTEQIETRPTDKQRRYETGWFDVNALPPMFWPEQREIAESVALTAHTVVNATE